MTAGITNDINLFQQIAEGNADAFREVFDKYRNVLFGSALKLTKDFADAEEIVQEIFVSLWISREKLAEVQDPKAYIFRALLNQVSNFFRKSANYEKFIRQAAGLQVKASNVTEETLNTHALQQRIDEAVEALPEQQRLVYKMNRVDGLKNDEIAVLLGISSSTVKKHLALSLQAIRTRLKDVAFALAVLEAFNSHSIF